MRKSRTETALDSDSSHRHKDVPRSFRDDFKVEVLNAQHSIPALRQRTDEYVLSSLTSVFGMLHAILFDPSGDVLANLPRDV